jgi:hypothetical protein
MFRVKIKFTIPAQTKIHQHFNIRIIILLLLLLLLLLFEDY